MDTAGRQTDVDLAAARMCLQQGVASLTGEPMERRHEVVMEWAETVLAMDRGDAEQIYALAEEEKLEPIYAFMLIRCGIGVRELTPPEQDMEDIAAQQAPPDWVGEGTVTLADVSLERRLRASFRRFRSHLAEAATPADAVNAFVNETDVGVVELI